MKRTIALLVAALVFYIALIGYRGVLLLGESRPALKVLGVAVLLLPLVGVWVVIAELRFGRATERLARRLPDEAEDPLPRLPSGRPDRRAADDRFAERRAAVESAPDDWRAWYRLAVAYDDAGDRRRARGAMRTAIEKSS